MATISVYEVNVKVTKIEEEEKDQYGKVIKPSRVVNTGTVDIKDHSAEKVLTRLESIVPML